MHATVVPAIAEPTRQTPLVVTLVLSLERTVDGTVVVAYPPAPLEPEEPVTAAATPCWDDEPTWEDAEWC